MSSLGRSLDRRGRIAVPLLLAAAITAIAIQVSREQGRLMLPPTYDDVSYFVDALRRVNTLEDSGAWAAAREWARRPPHAPVSTVLAGAGYLVFGPSEWAPYAMNCVVLGGMLAGVWALLRGVSAWLRVVVLVAFSALPIVWVSVTEFRPDLAAAVCTAAGVLVALDGELLADSPRIWRRWALMGAAFGGALLCKPATFPFTLAVFALSGALAVLADVPRLGLGGAVRRGWRAGVVALAGAAVVAAPYFLFGAADAYAYVKYNMFGPAAGLWRRSMPAGEALRYYLDGLGGRFMLGAYAYPVLAIALVGGACSALRGDGTERRRALALGAVVGAAFLTAALNPMKSQFFGLPFQVLLVAAALLALRCVLARPSPAGLGWWAGPALACVLAAASVAAFRFPNRWGSASDPRTRGTRAVFDKIAGDIASRVPRGREVRLLCTFSGSINATNLEFECLRRGALVRGDSRERAATLAEYGRLPDQATFVLGATEGTRVLASGFPSAAAAGAVLKELDGRTDLRRLAVYPLGEGGGELVLFQRRGPAEGTE